MAHCAGRTALPPLVLPLFFLLFLLFFPGSSLYFSPGVPCFWCSGCWRWSSEAAASGGDENSDEAGGDSCLLLSLVFLLCFLCSPFLRGLLCFSSVFGYWPLPRLFFSLCFQSPLSFSSLFPLVLWFFFVSFPPFWVSPSLSFPRVLVSLPTVHGFFFFPPSFVSSVSFFKKPQAISCPLLFFFFLSSFLQPFFSGFIPPLNAIRSRALCF